jgi:hypothetical protein
MNIPARQSTCPVCTGRRGMMNAEHRSPLLRHSLFSVRCSALIKLLLFFILFSFFASCKAPIPFYFDKPIGTACDSFPETMRGNFFAVDNSEAKKMITHSDEYVIQEDRIMRRSDEKRTIDSLMKLLPDTMRDAFRKMQDTLAKTIKKLETKPSGMKKESELLDLDQLYKGVDLDFDKAENKKLVFAFFRFTGTTVDLIGIDSAGMQFKRNIFTLSADLRLTKYKDKYFLNFKSSDGWEVMMFESWRKKFLCVVPLYITAYDDEKGSTADKFMTSVKALYPGSKPLYTKEGKVRGVKAKMNPDRVIKLLERSEQELLFLKPE